MAYLSSSQSLRPARRSVFAFITEVSAVRRQRAQLVKLSDEELSDIGITRAEAQEEASRPIWDLTHR